MRHSYRLCAILSSALLLANSIDAAKPKKVEDLWALQPVVQPEVPKVDGTFMNPIDAFIAKGYSEKNLDPLLQADRLTLLRRVHFDLIGLPPTPEEQATFLADQSAGAYESLVDRLLAHEQHGVRYARHWLDVLRYTDVDERMAAADGIHLWRDWVIRALNQDLPYDEFVRAQITGFRPRNVTTISATGNRRRAQPRPDDIFALGFLSRGATSKSNGDHRISISATETIGDAFLGMTVGCAKCHDHMYDPISQDEYYSIKAVFDPLVLRPVKLASANEIFSYGKALAEYEAEKVILEENLERLIGPYRDRLYEERLLMLPPEIQKVIRKPVEQRMAEEQKIADDYFPVLRIDPPKIREVMPEADIQRYRGLEKEIRALSKPASLPVFWTVEEDSHRRTLQSYVLDTGDPGRPKTSRPVKPGYPFARSDPDFRDGLREGFAFWLTDPENPLFARVAVNRIWQWHFGQPLHPNPSDFGALGGEPTHKKLLDWIAAEFVNQNYGMRWLHRQIVTSETYKRASTANHSLMTANERIDPRNRFLWRFPLKRLEAEPIWDALHFLAGDLDLSVGGKSFKFERKEEKNHMARRAIYMRRGYRVSEEIMPGFLKTFDVEDGRAVCSRRTVTVTSPQSLFLMNSHVVDEICSTVGQRLLQESKGDPVKAIELAYPLLLGRPTTWEEHEESLEFLAGDLSRLKNFVWLLVNLDEFIYVK